MLRYCSLVHLGIFFIVLSRRLHERNGIQKKHFWLLRFYDDSHLVGVNPCLYHHHFVLLRYSPNSFDGHLCFWFLVLVNGVLALAGSSTFPSSLVFGRVFRLAGGRCMRCICIPPHEDTFAAGIARMGIGVYATLCFSLFLFSSPYSTR